MCCCRVCCVCCMRACVCPATFACSECTTYDGDTRVGLKRLLDSWIRSTCPATAKPSAPVARHCRWDLLPRLWRALRAEDIHTQPHNIAAQHTIKSWRTAHKQPAWSAPPATEACSQPIIRVRTSHVLQPMNRNTSMDHSNQNSAQVNGPEVQVPFSQLLVNLGLTRGLLPRQGCIMSLRLLDMQREYNLVACALLFVHPRVACVCACAAAL